MFDAIRSDENGDEVDWGAGVWLGAGYYYSTPSTASTDTCNDWADGTSSSTGFSGQVGYNYGDDYLWFGDDDYDCDEEKHIYCVQISR